MLRALYRVWGAVNMGFGKLNGETLIGAVIGVIVLIYIFVALMPDFVTSVTTYGNTTYPLHGLFTSSGPIVLIFVAAVILGIIGLLWSKGKK